jgi:predicted peptidase
VAGQPRIAAAFATSSTTSDAPGCAETTLSASWNLLGDAYPISDDDEEAEQGSTTQASSVNAKEKKATVRSVPGRRQEYDKDRYQSKKDNIITNMKRAWMECNLIFGYHCRFCIKLHPSMRGKDSFSKG